MARCYDTVEQHTSDTMLAQDQPHPQSVSRDSVTISVPK